MEAGAEDLIINDDGSIDIFTTPDDFFTVKEAVASAGHEAEEAEITMRASTTSDLDLKDAEKMVRLLERLEDLDDVQNVYSNADISDEIMEQLG